MTDNQKKSSKVWNHFKRETIGDKMATCNVCKTKISYKTTITNLKNHLKRKHVVIFSNLEKVAVADKEDFTKRLVQAVRGEPALYQPGHDRAERRQLWEKIALQLGEVVSYCKEEWRCLRLAFENSKKEMIGETTSHTDEDMEEMSFLTPYLDDVEQDGSSAEGDPQSDPLSDEDVPETKFRCVDTLALQAKSESTLRATPRSRRRRGIAPAPQPAQGASADGGNESEARRLFLLSLLPDVEIMTNAQMRRFKRRVLELVDDVLAEGI